MYALGVLFVGKREVDSIDFMYLHVLNALGIMAELCVCHGYRGIKSVLQDLTFQWVLYIVLHKQLLIIH
jgi:hypothetical protein